MRIELFGGRAVGGWSAHGEYEHGVDPAIKACPFCRDEHELECSNTHTPYYWVSCNSCGAEGPSNRIGDAWTRRMSKRDVEALHRDSFHKAIADWNERP